MQTSRMIGWASLRRKAARRRVWRGINVVVAITTIINVSAFGAFVPHTANAADTGFVSPSANAQNGAGDAWTTPANAYTNGAGAATDNGGHRHRYSNFGFVVPTGSIQGLEVNVDAWSTVGQTSFLTDNFGTGSTSATVTGWTENGSGTEARAATATGNDTASSDGGRFAAIYGSGGYICRSVTATGLTALQLSYFWRGDTDANNPSDDGIVEYKTSGNCTDGSGWTQLQNHDLQNDGSWSTQSAFALPAALNNATFLLRFRAASNQSDEYLRIDGVNLTGIPSATSICQIGVDLSWDGGTTWTTEKTQNLTGTEATYTLGGASDTWGHAWTPAELSNASFVARVHDVDPGASCADTATTNLDLLQARVNYTESGTITIQKQFDTNGDGIADITGSVPNDILSNWEFSVAGASSEPQTKTTDTTGSLSFTVTGDTYTVSESAFDSNTHTSHIQCTSGEVSVGTVNLDERTVSDLAIQPGQVINCVYLNSIDTATITVHKHVVPVSGPAIEDPANWSWSLQAVQVDQVPQTGLAGGTTMTLPVLTDYQITEATDNYPTSAWTASYSCTANGEAIPAELGGAGNGITLFANLFERDEDLVCTFTNTQIPANVTVLKNVDENGDGDVNDAGDIVGATDWTWDVNGGNQNFATGSTQALTPGSTVISEDQKSGYEFVSVACTTGERALEVGQGQSVTLNTVPNGQSTCTFTNKKQTTSIGLDATGPATTNPGQQITYSIAWSVAGNTSATNTVITDTLPDNTTFVSTNDGGTFSAASTQPVAALANGKVVWNLGTKAPGTGGSVNLTVQVNSSITKATTLTNTATFDTDQTAALTDVVTTSVVIPQVLGATAEPKLTIHKTVDTTTTNPGKKIVYTVVVKNTGDATADNVIVTDTLPTGLTFTDSGRATKSWTIASLAVGASKSIAYTVTVSADAKAGDYTNHATAMADGLDPVTTAVTVNVIVPQVLGLATTGPGPRDYAFFALGLILFAFGLGSVLTGRYRRELMLRR